MHKDLVLNAFKKARREVKEATGVNMSVTGLSKQISDYMMEECHFQYHEKSLRNKYNIAVKDELIELKNSVANCLCCYLGYENYTEFVLENNRQETDIETVEKVFVTDEKKEDFRNRKETSMGEKLKIIIHKNKVTLIFLLVIFFDVFRVTYD